MTTNQDLARFADGELQRMGWDVAQCRVVMSEEGITAIVPVFDAGSTVTLHYTDNWQADRHTVPSGLDNPLYSRVVHNKPELERYLTTLNLR